MKKYNEFKYYWTDGKTILFKPDFNYELDDNFYEIIKNHEEIFFANYHYLSEVLKEKNDENYINKKCYIISEFNKKIKIHNGLKSVILGHKFNQEIKLSEGLESIKFGNKFNKEIKLPKELKNIVFGNNFNKKIELTDKLETVKFGYWFNQNIKLLEGLKSVKFGYWFNQNIKLPEGLENIEFGYYFNQEIKLPKELKSVIFGNNFNKKIKLPIKLKVISISKKFKLNLLSNNLEKININCSYGFNLNKNINYITNKIKKIFVPSSMRILKNLPNSVKLIVFNSKRKNVLNKFVSQIKISR